MKVTSNGKSLIADIKALPRKGLLPRCAALAFLASQFMAVPAHAQQTQTDETMKIVGQIADLHASLDTKTVTMKGAIGTLIGETLYFKNDHGQFEVQFDAGRNARKSIEGCELEWFGWANSSCVVEVDAEIDIKTAYTFADGGEIKLIVYEVRR